MRISIITRACLVILLLVQGAVCAEPSDRLPLHDVQRFTTALGQIKSFYVDDIEDSKLFEDAIRGMLTGLDPHSSYLDEQDFSDLKDSTRGEFGGLGIEVGMKDGYVHVISPIDDTPAAKAGLKSGDMIVRLDGKPVKGLSLQQAVKIMRGEENEPIDLTIFREKAIEKKERLFNVKIVRAIIRIESVKAKMLDDGYGYIRLSHFQLPTGNDLLKALEDLKQKAHGHLKGLVLDMRNNPGGLLDAAIQVADTFLDRSAKQKFQYDNMIVYTEGRLPGAKFEAKATPGDQLQGAPLIVLINQGSASASEIVAGALQDHKRAVLMGTNSFGKGSVQTVLPLDDKRGLKLTTALYFTPSGRSIQAKGIQPDILVQALTIPKQDKTDEIVQFISEADLVGHLDSADPDAPKAKDGAEEKTADNGQELLHKDYQLYQALNMLKGMHLLSQR